MDHFSNPWMSVPDSILLQIFSCLPFQALCKAAQVCQSWRRVAFDGTLRKIVDVRDTPLPVQHIKKLIRTQCSTSLHDLRLRGFIEGFRKPIRKVTTLTPECLSLLEKSSPNLKCLTMEDAFLVKDGKRPNINFSHFPKGVEHLSLHGSLFQTDLQRISDSVVCLNLGKCTFITSYDLQIFSDSPNLCMLYLEGCFRVNDRGIEHLITVLPQLRVLDLEATSISDGGVMTLFKNCVCMEELYIGHNKGVTDAAVMFLENEQMPKLNTLCAVYTDISGHMHERILMQLPNVQTVVIESVPGESRSTCAHHLRHKCPVRL